MVDELHEGLQRTDEDGMEGKVTFNMTAKKAIIVDVLILGLIICSVIGGVWIGQKIEFEKTSSFYEDYMDANCKCDVPLKSENGQIIWESRKFSYNFVE